MLKRLIVLGSFCAIITAPHLSFATQPKLDEHSKAAQSSKTKPAAKINLAQNSDTPWRDKKATLDSKEPVTPKVVRGIYYSPERQEYDIARVENYLNSLTTMVADFIQYSPDGSKQTGKFYLSRPGKLRWEYSPVPPVVIVARNGSVTYFDKELNQVSHVTTDDPLANILTRKQIEISGDLKVVYLDKPKDKIVMSLAKRKNPSEGRVTFTLSDPDMQLQGIEVTDSAGNITKINFTKVALGVPIKNNLFYINQNVDPVRNRSR